MSTGIIFQPFGVIPGEFKKKGLDTDVVMADWRPQLDPQDRIDTFNAFRENRLTEIATHIWPRFNFVDRIFEGPAKKFCERLTEFEVGIMIDAYMGKQPELDKKPDAPLAISTIESHRKHYAYEDQKPNPPGTSYFQYDCTITKGEEKEFQDVMLNAISFKDTIGRKSAGHFWLKQQLQRPRPRHAAMVFRYEKAFVSELTERGQHPSIVSGHCLQGILMCCAVLEQWLDRNSGPSAERQASLAQYMVDFGDRRVFAGVHYPTDNIASWTVALALIPEVFPKGKREVILDFVRQAILTRSSVFELITRNFTEKSVLEFTEPSVNLLKNYGLPT